MYVCMYRDLIYLGNREKIDVEGGDVPGPRRERVHARRQYVAEGGQVMQLYKNKTRVNRRIYQGNFRDSDFCVISAPGTHIFRVRVNRKNAKLGLKG